MTPGTILQPTAKPSAAAPAILIRKGIVMLTPVTMTVNQKIRAIQIHTLSISRRKLIAAMAAIIGTTIEIMVTQ